MFSIVLDTNVLISGLYSSSGPSNKLLELLESGLFRFHISVPVIFEYEMVLKRMKKDLSLTVAEIDKIIDYICSIGIGQEIHYLWRPQLRNPKDEMILELAVNAQAEIIVTYNVSDFTEAEKFGIQILRPKEFLKLLRRDHERY